MNLENINDLKIETIPSLNNVVKRLKREWINPINGENDIITVCAEVTQQQVMDLQKFGVNLDEKLKETMYSECKKQIGCKIFKSLLEKAKKNKEITIKDLKCNLNERYFIIGTLLDITTSNIYDNCITDFDSISEIDVERNPIGIYGKIKINNAEIDVIYVNEHLEDSNLVFCKVKDYDNAKFIYLR